MECTWNLWGLCLVRAGSNTETIFGFSEFLSGLAMLIIVYTITDFRYKFRVSVSRLNFNKFVYFLIVGIGIGTLITEIWVAQSWPTIRWNLSQAIWQTLLATAFLIVIMTWIWNAFISPPRFEKSNYKKYSTQLYRVILKGNEEDLNILSDELAGSIPNIVKFANRSEIKTDKKKDNVVADYAFHMALLLSNKKLCQCLVAKAPNTAIVLFTELANEKKIHSSSFSILTSNLSAAFIQNKNSLLYHEDNTYDSGLLGHYRPLRSCMYGNYKLIETLGDKSIFDINYKVRESWDAEQVEIFGKAILLCFTSYLEQGYWGQHSFTLYRAISDMESFSSELRYSNDSSLYGENVPHQKFSELITFASKLSQIMEERNNTPSCSLLRVREMGLGDFYDRIARLYCECIFVAACIKRSHDNCWGIQYSLVWSQLINPHRKPTKARKILMHKVRRNIYNSIKEMDTFPNFKAARLLSICLNVMWTGNSPEDKSKKEHEALRRVVVKWFKISYLKLAIDNPSLADACLTGSISLDKEGKVLIKSFNGMGRDVLSYFPLDEA
jgi:hypothetical protein